MKKAAEYADLALKMIQEATLSDQLGPHDKIQIAQVYASLTQAAAIREAHGELYR